MRKPYYAAIFDEREALVEKWVWSCRRDSMKNIKRNRARLPKLTAAKLKHLNTLFKFETLALS